MSNRSWTKENFEKYVKSSLSISQVLKQLGLDVSSGNYRTFYKYKEKWNIDTSHFLGRGLAWKKGLSGNKPKPLEEILTEDSWYARASLRKRLIKEGILEEKCVKCGIVDWEGEPLAMHLDHINGIKNDNRLENLRFLCPNCHCQTATFGSKRFKDMKTNKKKNNCIDCGEKIYKNSFRCKSCASSAQKRPTKIDWPDTSKLREMVKFSSYIAVGRKLGVSDNAVRKRIKNHPEE